MQCRTPLCVKIAVSVRERLRETDGWSCLYSQRCTRRRGGSCVLWGGHGWGDVIDMTGSSVPWREREIQIDRNRDSAEEGSPWQTDRSRERNAERRQTDRSGRWDSEINPGGRWQNNLSEERVGPGRWREIYQELPRFRRFCFSGRKKSSHGWFSYVTLKRHALNVVMSESHLSQKQFRESVLDHVMLQSCQCTDNQRQRVTFHGSAVFALQRRRDHLV